MLDLKIGVRVSRKTLWLLLSVSTVILLIALTP